MTSGPESFPYVGSELELFREAVNWKQTLRRKIQPFIRGDVLEVGAGIGGTTRVLRSGTEASWTCVEPDPSLVRELRMSCEAVEVVVGTIAAVPEPRRFDTIVYIDVLEHIEDDRDELRKASRLLSLGGSIVVLSPAHQWLFSKFDSQIGHFRRYSRRSLRELAPAGMAERAMIYLDSAGMIASAANRFLLSRKMPTAGQIQFWDTYLVRLSHWLDPLLAHTVGKSILAVWELDGSDRSAEPEVTA